MAVISMFFCGVAPEGKRNGIRVNIVAPSIIGNTPTKRSAPEIVIARSPFPTEAAVKTFMASGGNSSIPFSW